MDREKVIKGLECLAQKQEQMANPCSKCDYHDRPNFAFCVVDVATDALELLKEQEEREKAICKEICDFIRGGCSTDTDDDKNYVCHEIQKIFYRT